MSESPNFFHVKNNIICMYVLPNANFEVVWVIDCVKRLFACNKIYQFLSVDIWLLGLTIILICLRVKIKTKTFNTI